MGWLVPSFLLKILIAIGVRLVTRYGLPWVEANCPYLRPLIEAILQVIKGAKPSEHLSKSAEHYNMLCSGAACPPDLKKV